MKVFINIILSVFVLIASSQFITGQSCSGYLGALSPGNDISTDKICAPVTATWSVRYDRVDYGATPANSSIRIVWGDGNTIDYPYTVGVADNEVHLLSAVTHKIQLIAIHTYPATNDLCRYQPEAYLVVSGVQCLGSKQTQLVLSWNNEQDGQQGELLLNETATSVNIFRICENDAATITFTDRSTFNCVPPIENDVPNNQQRWIRLLYGTFNNATYAARPRIPNIVVNGISVTNGAGSLINNLNGNGATEEYYGPLAILPTVVTASNVVSYNITVPAAGKVSGQVFEITLQNWNYCNQYDDLILPAPGRNGDYPPKTTTALIEIITSPPDLSSVNSNFCIGSNLSVTVNPSLPGGTIRWYTDLARTHLVWSLPTFDPTNNPTLVADQLTNLSAGTKTYYVTEALGPCESDPSPIVFTVRNALTTTGPVTCSKALNLCPGEAGITFSVPNNPPTQTYGGTTEYFWSVPTGWTINSGQGTKSINVNVGSNTGSQTVSVYLRYTTSPQCPAAPVSLSKTVNAFPTGVLSGTQTYCNTDIDAVADLNPDINVTISGATPLTIVYTDGLTHNFTINNVLANVSNNNPGLPLPLPGALTTYSLVSVTDVAGCAAPPVNMSGTAVITVREALTLPGSITGNSPICPNDINAYTLTNGFPPIKPIGGATQYQWWETSSTNPYPALDWLDWNDGTPGNSDVESDDNEHIKAKTVAISTTRRLRARLGYTSTAWNGNYCYTGYLNKDIVVHPLPSATLSGTATICQGSSTNLVVNISQGVAPFTVVYNDGTSNFSVINLVLGNNNISVSPAATTSYHLVSIQSQTSPNCNGTVNITPITVTVNPTPTAAITGSTTICNNGSSATITFALTGVGPFNVTYSANGINQPVLNAISNGYTLTVSPTATTTYALVSMVSTNAPVCTGTLGGSNVVITVDQPPATAAAGLDILACSPTIFEFLSANSPAPGTGLWTLISKPIGAVGLQTFSDATSPTSKFTITTGEWGVYTLRWTTSNGVCPSSSDDVNVDFGFPPTVANAGANNTVCFPTYTLAGNTPAIGIGTWSTVSGPGIATFVDTHNPLSDVTVSVDGTYVFRWTISSGACTPSTSDVQIVFKPKPVITAISNISVCPGDAISAINFTSTPAGATFSWVNSNTLVGLGASGSPNISSWTAPANISGTPIIGTVTVSAVLAGCNAADVNFTVTINPKPVVTAIGDFNVCPGDLIAVPAFSANTSGGETFSWTNSEPLINLAVSGSGNIAAFNAGANISGVNRVGNINVYATKAGCVSDPETFQVIVKPTPVITAIADKSFCPGDIYVPAAFVSTPAGASFSWTNNQAGIGLGLSGVGNIPTFTTSANVTGLAITGLITVAATLNSCSATNSTYNIIVNPQPIIDNIADISSCPGDLITAPAFTTNAGGGETFTWTNSNPAIGLASPGSGNVSFTASANATNANITGTISVTATRLTCVSPVKQFNITVKPTPVITAIPNFDACPGATINPELISTPAGANFTWTNSQTLIGLGASGTGDITSFSAANNISGSAYVGTINVSASLNTCPASNLSFTITVRPKPVVANVTDILACPGDLINPGAFTANTGGGESFSWTNSNLNIGIGPSGTGNITSYTAPSNTSGVNYLGTISIIATLNTCQSSAKTFTITVKPTPQLTQIADLSVCPGTNINPDDFVSTPAGAIFNWTNLNTTIGLGGSGSGQIIPFIATANTTAANNDAIITTTGTLSGCASPAMSFTIRIKPTPILTPLTNIIVCPGDNIIPDLFQTNPSGSDFSWVNSNSSIGLALSGTDQIAGWSASNSTTDSIKSIITVTPQLNSCIGGSESFSIIIKPKPFLNPISSIIVCPTETVNVPAFTATPSGSTFSWTNSNTLNGLGSSGTGDIASYIAPSNTSNGYYTGTVTANANLNGCNSNNISFQLTVKPTPGTTAISGTANVCASTATSTSTQIYRVDAPSGTPGSTYTWSITSSNPLAAAPSNFSPFNNSVIIDYSLLTWTGTLSVVETSFEGCVGSPRTTTLRSYEVPTVNAGLDTTICAGNSVMIGGFPSASGGSLSYTYSWTPTSSLDDATKANPMATPAVQTIYRLVVTDAVSACVSQPDYIQVQISPLPAAPTAINQSICYGDPTPDLTAVGTSIRWYTDDLLTNLVSTNNPFTTGEVNPGTYVFYATQTINGCESTARQVTLTINAIPTKPTASNVTVCYGQTVPDLIASGSGVRWFDDPVLTHLVKNGNTFTTNKTDPATYTYYVTQTVNNCQSPSDTVILTIKAKPSAPTTSDITVCGNQTIPVIVAVGQDVKWYSDIFLNTLVVSNDTLNSGMTLPGTYTYYATQTVNGCQSTAKSATLIIRPIPEIISAFATDETVCNSGDGKVTVIASGTPPLNYSINGGASYSLSGNFSNLGNGNYPIVVQNNYGCTVYGDTLVISSGSAPNKPQAGTSAIYCQGQSLATLTATPFSGGQITWYTDAGLTVPLSHNLTFNPNNVIGTTHYYVTETSGGCESQSTDVTITINPMPLAPQISDTLVCTGMGVPVLYAKGDNIFWYNDAALTQVVNYGNYYPTGVTAANTYTWYLASTESGCRGPMTKVILTIKQTPATPVGTSSTSCFGEPLPNLSATGGNVLWYTDSGLTNLVHTGNTFNTGNTVPNNYRYYIVDVDGTCRSAASTVVQTIYSTPTKPIGLDRTICEGDPTPSLVASGALIKWYGDALLTNFLSQGSILNVSNVLPGTYSYYATQTLNGCQGPADTVVLVIKPKPAVPTSIDVTSCEGTLTPNLTATGTNLTWYYGPTQVGTGSSFASGRTSPGTYSYFVNQTINGCQGDYKQVLLTINPAPVFGGKSYHDQTACNSNDGDITISAAGTPPLSYSIDDGFTYQAGTYFGGLKNGLYPIMIKNGFGCTSPGDTIDIKDGGAPNAPFAVRDTAYCMNDTFDKLKAFASVGGVLTWYSDWGLKDLIQLADTLTPKHTSGTTMYYVTETSGGCESDPTVLKVSVDLVPNPPISSDTVLCYGLTVPNLTATGNGIEWFNNPSLSTVIATGSSYATGKHDPGTYVYYVTQLINGCRSQATTDSLVIHPLPVVDFDPDVVQGCAPLQVNFANSSTGTSFIWTFGDQTSDTINFKPSHTFINNSFSQKNFAIKLKTENQFGCTKSLTKYLTVFPAPNYAFSTVPDVACSPVNVNFLSLAGASNYDWNFGDATTLSGVNSSPAKTYVNDTYNRDTSYVISLVATSAYGCVGTYKDTLLVHPKPDVSFAINQHSGCSPFVPILSNQSIGATIFKWNFGDNTTESTDSEPIHTFTNSSVFSSSYLVMLTAGNIFGCSNTYTQSIEVFPPVTASFSANTSGCAPFSTTFLNMSVGSNLSYAWTTSNGLFSGALNPTLTFNNYGFADSTYTVRLVARSQYNCFDTLIKQVVVYETPHTSFQVDPQTMVYPQRTVSIIQNTPDAPASIWKYKWTFGDGSVSTLPNPLQQVYDTSGVYAIKLKVDGTFCSDTLTRFVHILLPPPVADFDSIPPNCSPYNVSFTNKSVYAETFHWTFGDGWVSNLKKPDHLYYDAGTFVVTLQTAGPSGNSTKSRVVKVFPTPIARFDVAPNFVYVPSQPVKCFNQSLGDYIYEWDFGDNTPFSTDTFPIHYYQLAGEYNIKMIVKTNTIPQCLDSLIKEKAVVAQDAGIVNLPNAFRPSAGGPNGGYYTPNGYNNNIFYPPIVNSVIDYKLTIYNRWGQKIFESNDIHQGWDGYFNGKICDQDVYVWRVEGKYANKQTFLKVGDVTLIR